MRRGRRLFCGTWDLRRGSRRHVSRRGRGGGPTLRSFSGGFASLPFSASRSCGRSFGVRDTSQLQADFLSDFDGNRTRVSFLLGHAEARQEVDNGFGLDLQLAS